MLAERTGDDKIDFAAEQVFKILLHSDVIKQAPGARQVNQKIDVAAGVYVAARNRTK